eukprot:TRINITY_DN2433_c0_g3_i1.p1 TRINITY_DN2433_c0_g3~~TRINITY_DN2433_c0_g3_i1.p1  ORF type:complete len:385 (+),score=-35.41 TRINITY_DN2433_c0_g3_i1:111-1157(+)
MADKANEEVEALSALPLKLKLIGWFVKQVGNVTRRSDGSVNRALLNLLQSIEPADPQPRNGVATADYAVECAAEPGAWLRLFTPAADNRSPDAPAPLIVYFHGGGFCTLSAATRAYDHFCRALCREFGAVVASVDYRLAPEHKFPAAYDDSFAALTWLESPRGRRALPAHVDLGRCFLVGDSAGGNIVHHVGLRWAEESKLRSTTGSTELKIVGHVLIQPYFGGAERTAAELRLEKVAPLISVTAADWYWKAFLPEGSTRDHRAANVMAADRERVASVDFPRSLVVIGGLDTLQDWQRKYVELLVGAGKSVEVLFYKEGIHGFHLLPIHDLAFRFLKDLHTFLVAPNA